MKSFGSRSVFAISITIAGVLCLVIAADSATEFRRCYNISKNTHCFEAQYDTTTNQWLSTSFENARKRCRDRDSTLLIIKDEETDQIVQQYMSDSSNPVYDQFFWIDAYLVNNNINNTYTWHWVDSSLPNVPASDVALESDDGWYVAALEYRNDSFYLTAKQPRQAYNYICKYPVRNCSAAGSIKMRLFGGRCYDAINNDSVSWYEARNRCLKGGGDLASFPDVSSINFTSWLVSSPPVPYWIGLRFSWYIWIDIGEEVRYSKWIKNDNGWNSSCLTGWWNWNPSFSWYPQDCNTANNVYVVCHTVTPITISTTSTTKRATIATVGSSTSTGNFHSSGNHPLEEPIEIRSARSIEIGLRVFYGVGSPIIISLIVMHIYICMRIRKSAESTTARDNCELSTIPKLHVAQQSDPTNDQYQHPNRNQDNCSGTENAQLGIEPERSLEDHPSSD